MFMWEVVANKVLVDRGWEFTTAAATSFRIAMHRFGANLAVVGALNAAWCLGYDSGEALRPSEIAEAWWPGCLKPAPAVA